jgi:hypothetical protein
VRRTVIVALGAVLSGCSGVQPAKADGSERKPPIESGCEKVKLFVRGERVPFEYRFLREFSGVAGKPNQDLRHWLINHACAEHADALINVTETIGHDTAGKPVRSIRGDAVVVDRTRPNLVH